MARICPVSIATTTYLKQVIILMEFLMELVLNMAWLDEAQVGARTQGAYKGACRGTFLSL